MNDEDFAPVSRDLVETKYKWYLRSNFILICGMVLGSLFTLCTSAIIDLTINVELRTLFLTWQNVPLNVWLSIISFVLFIIIIYYFKLSKNVK